MSPGARPVLSDTHTLVGTETWKGFGPDLYAAGIAVGESVGGVQTKAVVSSLEHCWPCRSTAGEIDWPS